MQNRSKVIRSGIKASIGQLDSWDQAQIEQARKRQVANSRFPHGLQDRLALARHRASQSTETPRENVGESNYCYFCDSGNHSTADCNVTHIITDPVESASENPSEGIHRAIVHRVYLQGCELYRLLYPRWYPGPEPKTSEKEEVFPVPTTGPDYFSIAIIQAVEDLKSIPGVSPSDIRKQKSSCTSLVQLYFSKAFPLNFSGFCDRVADKLEENLEEEE